MGFLIILLLLCSSIVSAATVININLGPVNNQVDQKVVDAMEKSVPLQFVTYYILGIKQVDDSERLSGYGAATVLIVFFLIWLILFVSFADILVAFSPFSNKAVGWIIAGAITIIAANLQLVQYIALFFIYFTGIFGTISVFVGILTSFAAFLAISIGMGRFAEWALERKARIEGHRGNVQVAQGIRGLAGAGRGLALEGERQQRSATGWIIGTIIVIVLIIGALIIFGG